ncbi:MAG: acetate--CoA ligase [Vicinamibacterales bacterium]|nr:acetate--CoA ligase [Vicinamibacterales bacterium]
MNEQTASTRATGHPTRWAPLVKRAPAGGMAPNLRDYDQACAEFSWDQARGWLDGLPGGRGLNIAHEAIDRHAAGGNGHRVALRWMSRNGAGRDFTYDDLRKLTNRFANVLCRLGIGQGDVVATLAGRIPCLYIAALGALKNRSVYAPLYSAFGPDPIVSRMTIARARVLVTTDVLYHRKVASIREQMPALEHVLLVRETAAPLPPATWDCNALLDAASDEFTIPPTDPQDLALLHFTSGTTGQPKGAMHVHEAVVAHYATARFALDCQPGDRFWCTADPGWVTGTSYGIIAPLTHGLTMIVDEADFEAERWYRIIRDERVTIWYTAPTAIRMLMKAGTPLARQHDLRSLRFLGSVGEPLDPEGVVWGVDAFDHPFHDNWWQTETGGIMIANFASMDIRPGSMGRPLPGVVAAIVRPAADGGVEAIDEPGVQGELALRPGWPSMFRGYLGDEERYRNCFAGGYYLTGDLARRDPDGYYWFVGRADDVIKSSGHLIGPFEVESALLEHEAVAGAGVIGKPDPVAGEIVKAFVTLKPGFAPDEAVRRSIQAHARTRLGAVVAPKEVAFVASLPLTRSGKIMRRLLKARELGWPEGDTSTLEPS